MSPSVSSAVEERMLVAFFSLAGFTSMSPARAFSPTIIPSYTSAPGPINIVPRSCRLVSAYDELWPRRSATRLPVGLVRRSPFHDDGPTMKTADVRQRLGEDLGLECCAMSPRDTN